MSKGARLRKEKASGDVFGGPAPVLSSYDPVEVTVPRIVFPDDVIEDQITQLAQRMKAMQPVEPRPLRPDDRIYIDMTTVDEAGERFENLCGKRHVNLSDGFIPQGFKDGLMELEVGKEKSFEYDAPTPDNDADGNAITIPVQATVTLLEIQEERVPEITDEWVKKSVPGADTVEELRKNVREQMEAKAGAYTRSALYELCSTALAARLEGGIPDAEFERGILAAQQEFDAQVKKEKTTKELYLKAHGMNEDQLSVQLMAQGRSMVAQGRALEAMARHLGLTVTDEDIEASFGEVTPAQARNLRQAYEDSGRGAELKRMALCGKALDHVVKTAKITYRDMPQTLAGSAQPSSNRPLQMSDVFGGSRSMNI